MKRLSLEADYNDLKLFNALATAGSFTSAASTLGISKSLASKRLRELEARLGVVLIERSTRGLRLTPAGQAFQSSAENALRAANSAFQNVLAFQSRPMGLVRISAPMSLGARYIAPKLGALYHAYPEIVIDLYLDDMMTNGDIHHYDIQLLTHRPRQKGLVIKRLIELESVLAASPDYPADITTPFDVGKENCLTLSRHGQKPVWKFSGPDGTVSEVFPTGSLILNNSDALCASVQKGLGIARLPQFIAAPLVAAGQLKRLLKDYRMPTRDLYIAFPEGADTAPAVRTVIDFLASIFTPKRPPWGIVE